MTKPGKRPKIRIPLPKKTEAVLPDKTKYVRKKKHRPAVEIPDQKQNGSLSR